MIAPLALALLLVVADSNVPPPAAAEMEREEFEARRTAEIAIRSAEEEVARLSTRSVLIERLLEGAKTAYAGGRYGDAIGLARRVRLSAARRGQDTARTTRPVAPAIEPLYEALERLLAAENRGVSDPLVTAARELVASAEAALEAGNITQADHLARRAILMLSALPPPVTTPEAPTDTTLDVNRASPVELARLPGMTSERVRNLAWFRQNIGPLRALEEIRFVPGFSWDDVILYLPWLKVASAAPRR